MNQKRDFVNKTGPGVNASRFPHDKDASSAPMQGFEEGEEMKPPECLTRIDFDYDPLPWETEGAESE